ncbi:uncharacterized protein LACBIDRAFT_312117 [Laccaria bicolor S238N-H82]|uniref:Predicted protein n=1 Tax=Laccaria bicolor (strain S238N-H82 / ATCC MYA-4686) TaxID=486041 RepID=B0CZ43_LACBS|nr:uncharacterized protein LACBIDRAFT_312117 [Laccaria bicolor S238N-H82]EDR12999.1 predicted protein [Laccaria bicolor S238N-H82]|eukprot:XP_001877263.1 predicted protein [Laccaria bicolor S238N-H82]
MTHIRFPSMRLGNNFTPGRCAESALAVLSQRPHSPHRPRILCWSKSSILQPALMSSTPPSTSSTMSSKPHLLRLPRALAGLHPLSFV